MKDEITGLKGRMNDFAFEAVKENAPQPTRSPQIEDLKKAVSERINRFLNESGN